MAVYNALQPLTQVADLPEYMKPTWFRKKNGQNTMFGDVFNVAVPALATIGGGLIGGPLGASIGKVAGQAAVGAINRGQASNARHDGSEMAEAQIDNDLSTDLSRANVASSLAGMVNITPGKAAVPGVGTPTAQSVNPAADGSGLGQGVLDVTGMSGYNQAKADLVNQFTEPSTSMQPATPFKVSLNPTDPSLLPGLIQQGVNGFAPRKKVGGGFGTSYQKFADGGIIEPLAPRPFQDNAAARAAKFGRILNNRIDDGVEAAPLISDASNQANAAGTGYVKNWLNSRGYGQYADNLPAPVILPEQEFKKRYGLLAGGSNDLQDDGSTVSYLRDGMGADFIRTAATEETAHAAQRAMANVPEVQQTKDLINSRINIQPGLAPETAAYLGDWREADARLFRMREAVGQDPNKRFSRLGWMFKTLFNKPQAYKDLQQVMSKKDIFKSLNDTFAEGGKVGTDYHRYNPLDKVSEDLLIFNPSTGKMHGALRFGERIYDQEATDHIDSKVKTLKLTPSKDGFYELGKFVFDETLTHKDHKGVQRFADGGKTQKPSEKVKSLQAELKKVGYYKGEENGIYSDDLETAIGHWNATARLTGKGGHAGIELIRGADNSIEDFKIHPSTGQFMADQYKKDKWEPEILLDNPPAAPESTAKPAPAPVTATPSGPSILNTPVAKAKAETPVGTAYDWLSPGNIADAARTIVGYTQANRDLPENPINADYLKLVGQAKGQAGQGLGPASKMLFNNQIDDSRSLGIEAIRRTSGGGGSGGATLAALGNVNDATTNAALKLAAADEQAQLVNQSKYANLLGGQIDMEQQRFGMAYNAALANKQAGINLAQQGLQSIQNRYDVWNLYDNPNSSLAKFAARQQANQAAAQAATERAYTGIGQLLTNTVK